MVTNLLPHNNTFQDSTHALNHLLPSTTLTTHSEALVATLLPTSMVTSGTLIKETQPNKENSMWVLIKSLIALVKSVARAITMHLIATT